MALFSKRHYNLLAAKLNRCNDTIYNNECKFSWVVEELASMLAQDNPAFNRSKFIAAIFNDAEIKAWGVK